jgi:nucleotide-binding universal stress UspA family protein
MRILIAHDGSPRSQALLADLPRCGLPASGEALVLSVADAWTAVEGDSGQAFSGAVAGAGSDGLRAALADARRISDEGRAAAAGVLPGWSVEGAAVAGSPAWEIIRKADEWQPDLVLVAATGKGALERLVFGTTTALVLEHARCSVRVSRPRAGATGPVRLVLGCDGSEQAALAARHVAARRWPAGSSVRVVTSIDERLLGALDENRGLGEQELRRRAGELAERVAPELKAAGLDVQTVSKDGDPKNELAAEAAAASADCIVVGARGRTGLSRLLLGSVALGTAARAACSVEIVR